MSAPAAARPGGGRVDRVDRARGAGAAGLPWDYREGMNGLERWAIVLLIAAIVVGLAWVARYAALDVAKRGRPGWPVGVLILLFPPAGALMWLWYRDRAPLPANDRSPQPGESAPTIGLPGPEAPRPGHDR